MRELRVGVCMSWPYKFAKRSLQESQCGAVNLTVFVCLRAYSKEINNLSFICGCLGWCSVCGLWKEYVH